MLYASGLITKKISRKALTRHQPGNRFKDFMEGDFFNGAFKKIPQLSHEPLTRKQLFPPLTG
jgi:hypothetical protein